MNKARVTKGTESTTFGKAEGLWVAPPLGAYGAAEAAENRTNHERDSHKRKPRSKDAASAEVNSGRHSMELRRFEYKDAVYGISTDRFEIGAAEIVRQRDLLENFIDRIPDFRESFDPIGIVSASFNSSDPLDRPGPPVPPGIAVSMAAAAEKCGVGPMAAVAGAMAEAAVSAMIRDGASGAVVDNGGDLFLDVRTDVTVALYAGESSPFGSIAFRVTPGEMPCSICSSSGRMGHSASFGKGDLACVIATEGALADAAATRLCNELTGVHAITGALESIMRVEGIRGALTVLNGRIGLIGTVPRLIRHHDPGVRRKIAAHVEGRVM